MRLVTLFLCLILVSIFDIEAQVISLDSQNTNHFTITKNEQKRFSFVNSIVNIDSRIVKTKSGNFVKLIVPSYTFHSENIGKLLIEQIFSSVRWRESVINISKLGVSNFIEIGPGKVLSGIVKRTLKGVNCFSITSIADIKTFINELKK